MEGDTPLLISLHAQSTLGFIKDVQAGTCEMRHVTGRGPKDFEKIPIKLYNLKGSGLRAICISEFPAAGPVAEVMPLMSFAALEKTGEHSATVKKLQSQRDLAKSSSIKSISPERKKPFIAAREDKSWRQAEPSGSRSASSRGPSGENKIF